MPFQEINVNNLIGYMSAQALSLAVNGGGVAITTAADARFDIGMVRAPMPEGLARLVVHADGIYGDSETMSVDLRWQGADGAVVSTELVTLDETNVTGAGEFEFDRVDVSKIPVGSVISLVVDYTAGTPNDPVLTLAVQLY